MKRYIKHYLFLLIIAFVIIGLDQWTKVLVRENIALGSSWLPWGLTPGFFRFVYWRNTGAAFGIFQNANLPLLVLSALISVAILIYYREVSKDDVLSKIAMAMMLGGAIGNLIDRVILGFVTDFISVGTFPVFNIADSSITVGVGLLMLAMILQENRAKQELLNSEKDTEIIEELQD